MYAPARASAYVKTSSEKEFMKPVAKKAMTNAPPAEPIVELTAFRIASSRSFAAESALGDVSEVSFVRHRNHELATRIAPGENMDVSFWNMR